MKKFKTGRMYGGVAQEISYRCFDGFVFFKDEARNVDGFIDLLLPGCASEKEILDAYDNGWYRGPLNQIEIDILKNI